MKNRSVQVGAIGLCAVIVYLQWLTNAPTLGATLWAVAGGAAFGLLSGLQDATR